MNAKELKRIDALYSGAIKVLKKAVAKALAQHEAAGVPAAIWRNGKVVHLYSRRKKKAR